MCDRTHACTHARKCRWIIVPVCIEDAYAAAGTTSARKVCHFQRALARRPRLACAGGPARPFSTPSTFQKTPRVDWGLPPSARSGCTHPFVEPCVRLTVSRQAEESLLSASPSAVAHRRTHPCSCRTQPDSVHANRALSSDSGSIGPTAGLLGADSRSLRRPSWQRSSVGIIDALTRLLCLGGVESAGAA